MAAGRGTHCARPSEGDGERGRSDVESCNAQGVTVTSPSEIILRKVSNRSQHPFVPVRVHLIM